MPGTIEVNDRQYVLNVVPSLPDVREWKLQLPSGLAVADIIELDKGVGSPFDAWPAWLRHAYDQYVEGSCTGNAQSKLGSITGYGQGLPAFAPSRRFIYNRSRFLEGTISSDAGSSIIDSIKGMVQFGACSEADMPYVAGQFTLMPTANQLLAALDHQVLKYETVDQTAEGIGGALALGRPVSIGFVVYDNFAPGAGNIIPMPAGSARGGHNVLIVRRYHNQRMYGIFNSWSDNWGDGGISLIPYDYIHNPQLTFEMRTIDLVEGTPTPPPAPPVPPLPPAPSGETVDEHLLRVYGPIHHIDHDIVFSNIDPVTGRQYHWPWRGNAPLP